MDKKKLVALIIAVIIGIASVVLGSDIKGMVCGEPSAVVAQ